MLTAAPTSAEWQRYYEENAGRPPRALLLEAFCKIGREEDSDFLAIDLGCGDGAETLAMLARGWRVFAVDREPLAIAYVHAQTAAVSNARLETSVASFARMSLPSANFLYAGYSLPFAPAASFHGWWPTVVNTIVRGGWFAAHFLGTRDSWADSPAITCWERAALVSLLRSHFAIEYFAEFERDGSGFGAPKHWHTFEVIATKR